MSVTAEILLRHPSKLGEGPIWNEREQELAWVDINDNTVFLYDPKTKRNRALKTPTQVGTIVPRRSGGYVVALRDEIAALDRETGALTTLHRFDNPGDKFRYNDGKCDPNGRFWVGTYECTKNEPIGVLYRFDDKRKRTAMVEGVACSNGIVWSHDQRAMYYIDSLTRRIDAFDYEAATGAISNRRPALEIPDELGLPDGMTMDAEGMIWIGMWGSGVVLHADPRKGKMLGQIAVPGAKCITACAFGGRNLDELYITSSGGYLKPEEAKEQPNAGFLFVAKPGVRGVAACAYSG